MLRKLKNLFLKEDGQALTEYGLIIGLIAIVVIAVVVLLGNEIKEIFTTIQTELDTKVTT